MRSTRLFAAALAAATAVTAVAVTAAPGQAAPAALRPAALAALPAGAVVVPRQVADSTRILLFGSGGGFDVVTQQRQDATGGSYRAVLTGAEGTRLGQGIVGPDGDQPDFVVGTTGWFERPAGGTKFATIAVKYDLRTRTRTAAYGIGTWRMAAASTAGVVLVSQDGLSLGLLRPDGTKVFLKGFTPGPGRGFDRVAADGTTALFVYGDGTAGSHVGAITLSTKAFRRVASSSRDIELVALSPRSFVWLSERTGTPSTLHRLPRAGGADVTRTVVSRNTGTFADWMVATDASVLLRRYPPAGSRVTVVPADPARPLVDLPAAFRAVDRAVVTGGEYRVALSGRLATTAGVWRVRNDATRGRVATVPAEFVSPSAVDLSAGQVWYTSAADTSAPGQRVWRRTVSGTSTLTLGAEGVTAPPAEADFRLSVSGARQAAAAVGSLSPDPGVPPPHIALFDRGRRTGLYTGADPEPFLLSGPYLATGFEVRLPNGSVAFSGRTQNVSSVSVYGRQLAFAEDDGSVWTRSLTAPASAASTRLRAPTCTVPAVVCGPTVVAASDHVLWFDQTGVTGKTLTIRNLRTGTTRTVTSTAFLNGLVAGDGAAVWPGFALDLTDPTSTPVAFGTGLGPVAVDDHLVAFRDADSRVVVARLPFGGPHRPRLLGVVAPASFAASAGATWSPQLDLSKQVVGVTLTLRRGSTVVRTLTGSAGSGSVRGIVWDGKDSGGTRVAAGSYTWTLTGTAADGEGAVADVDGTGPVTGTVAVS